MPLRKAAGTEHRDRIPEDIDLDARVVLQSRWQSAFHQCLADGGTWYLRDFLTPDAAIDDGAPTDVVEHVVLGAVGKLKQRSGHLVYIEDLGAVAAGKHAHLEPDLIRGQKQSVAALVSLPSRKRAEAPERILGTRVGERNPATRNATLDVGADGRLVNVGDGLGRKPAIPRLVAVRAAAESLLHLSSGHRLVLVAHAHAIAASAGVGGIRALESNADVGSAVFGNEWLHRRYDAGFHTLLNALGDLAQRLPADVLPLDVAIVPYAKENLTAPMLVEHGGDGGTARVKVGRGFLVFDILGFRPRFTRAASVRSSRWLLRKVLYRETWAPPAFARPQNPAAYRLPHNDVLATPAQHLLASFQQAATTNLDGKVIPMRASPFTRTSASLWQTAVLSRRGTHVSSICDSSRLKRIPSSKKP